MNGVALIGFALAARRTRAFDNERRTLKTRKSESCIIAGQYGHSATRTTYPLAVIRAISVPPEMHPRGAPGEGVSSFPPAAPISSLSKARGSGSDPQ